MFIVKGPSFYLLQRYEFSRKLPNNSVKYMLIVR
nr:MAG TPA: hypothetical protein [Microviridae sp.]